MPHAYPFLKILKRLTPFRIKMILSMLRIMQERTRCETKYTVFMRKFGRILTFPTHAPASTN